jgi:hypothetical protein
MSDVPHTAQFLGRDSAFQRFLRETAGAPPTADERFIARNFLLDEGVSPERFESYERSGVTDFDALPDWVTAHGDYLLTEVERDGPSGGPPRAFDLHSADCPETFREGARPRWLHAQLGSDLSLVRVVSAARVAREIGADNVESLVADGHDVVANGPRSPRWKMFDGLIGRWVRAQPVKPQFAALWEGLDDLLPLDPSEAPPDWADRLRDRLGLLYIRPEVPDRTEAVLVFRYAVSDVPVALGSADARLIVAPTVLDGPFYEPFCPAPLESSTGWTVDLGTDEDAALDLLGQEVLHPPVVLRARHLFRLGHVTTVPPMPIADGRRARLVALQEEYHRPDYGQTTDGDLL